MTMTMSEVQFTPEHWLKFWANYKGQPHQQEAVELLRQHIVQSDPGLLTDTAEWVDLWRAQKPEPNGYITPEMMSLLTGYPPNSFDAVFCDDCNRLFSETGFIRHINAMQMLMANMMHETCNFIYMKEIADGTAYEGRSDLGNTQPGDGPRFKGAGVLQLTGRHNYQRLADAIGDQRVMEGVDYVADTYPFTSAKVWIEENDLLNVCLNQGFEACCVRINGGHRGYNDRCTKYAVCQRVME